MKNNDDITLLNGDVIKQLKTLPDECVNTCVTSPPYWKLRDYGVEGQIGLEKTPEEYVKKMVKVFSGVKRVLRDDGTLWLNLGDSYGTGTTAPRQQSKNPGVGANSPEAQNSVSRCGGMAKQLLGIPWRVALALQADGWYLRQDIIWHKSNPMPESVTDRCTKAHEYIFLLTKSKKYYYDNEAIKEPCTEASKNDFLNRKSLDNKMNSKGDGYNTVRSDLCRNRVDYMPKDFMRNKRSVWTVNTKPYKGAHFATFPEKLIEPCILAGCPEGGTVLDPFNGSGTTGSVSLQHRRKYIGIDLKDEYIELTKKRFSNVQVELF